MDTNPGGQQAADGKGRVQEEGKMKILAVDDDPLALDIVEAALSAANYDDVTTACSGQEALECVEAADQPFDCILLDIMMPGMDGIELCTRLRAMPAYAAIPIIMITAVEDQERLIQAIQNGATDYVNKPFDGLELGARLRAASLMSDALKHGAVKAPRPREPDERGFELCDPILLDPVPGALSQMQLCEELLAHADSLFATHIFAMSFLDIDQIFDALPPFRFRCLLNRIALMLSSEFASLGVKFAYGGNGLFTVVLTRGNKPQNAEVKTMLQDAVDAMEKPFLEGYSGALQLCFGFSPSSTRRSGANAVLGLTEASDFAQKATLPRGADAYLSKLRDELTREGKAHKPGFWFSLRPRHMLSADSRITPRRVLPKSKRDWEDAIPAPVETACRSD